MRISKVTEFFFVFKEETEDGIFETEDSKIKIFSSISRKKCKKSAKTHCNTLSKETGHIMKFTKIERKYRFAMVFL